METAVRGMPLEYPPKPERLNAYGKRRAGQGKEEARGQDGDLGKPRESVIVSVPVFVSASGSDPAFFPIPLALSLGVLDSGLRARRSGEHAELAVPEPDSAPDCAPLRVRGPSAGPPAIPGL